MGGYGDGKGKEEKNVWMKRERDGGKYDWNFFFRETKRWGKHNCVLGSRLLHDIQREAPSYACF